jgi:hypothetical protein
VSLSSWMVQTIGLASVTGVDAYGKSSYQTPRTVKARVQPQRRMVTTSSGAEAMSNHLIYTEVPVLLTDRVWLPGESTASAEASRVPISVTTSLDKSGSRTLYKVEL